MLGATSVENRYRVAVEERGLAWRVVILDPSGSAAHERTCRDEAEARTFASTVQQHLYWLSEPTFREYYRLPEP
jgi:hypothetical protein